jgi:hypothetical protein
VETKLDYRAEEGTLAQKMAQAGTDAAAVLAWVDTLSETVREGKPVGLLRRVWDENFERVKEAVVMRESQPTGAVKDPHDPEAQWSSKHSDKKTEWVGYKVQVAETVSDAAREKGEPTREFVTSVVTQPATHSDEAGMAATWTEQAASGLKKASELYVDGAYVSAGALAEAAAERRELVGPAPTERLAGERISHGGIRRADRATAGGMSRRAREHPVQSAGRGEDRQSELSV